MKVVPINTRRLVGLREGAQIIGVSYSLLYGLIKRNEIPYVEVPSPSGKRAGRLMLDIEDIPALIRRWKRNQDAA